MMKIRRIIYRLGFRPGLNSIFRSPSLELHYVMEAYRKDLEKISREKNERGKF